MQERTRKITRCGSLKCSVGNVAAANSPIGSTTCETPEYRMKEKI